MHEFSGLYAAPVTPRGKQGDIDLGAAFELIDHCSRPGIEGILLFGEEGEYLAFSPEERSRLTYLALKRSRVPLMAGVGSPTLDLSVTLAREAWNAGVAAILLPPPGFFRYQPDEIGEFYLQFASQMRRGTKVLLYNTPLSTSEIPLETAASLLPTGMFAGIADAGGDPAYFSCLSSQFRKWELLIASDALFAGARRAGCAVISALASVVPALPLALDRALAAGPHSELDCLQRLFEQFLDWAARFPRTVAARTAIELQGLKTGSPPVPLSPAKQRLLEEFREWFRGWLPNIRKLSANG